jgi:hypothetical protein
MLLLHAPFPGALSGRHRAARRRRNPGALSRRGDLYGQLRAEQVADSGELLDSGGELAERRRGSRPAVSVVEVEGVGELVVVGELGDVIAVAGQPGDDREDVLVTPSGPQFRQILAAVSEIRGERTAVPVDQDS